MHLSLIVAADERNAIGKQNALPWHLPEDFRRMKEITMGKPIIMGRKTHESIGRALPGRRNIVITRQKNLTFEGCDMVGSLEEAIELAKSDHPKEAFIFGGGDIFRQAMPLADRIYMTRVHTVVEGTDAFFPEIDPTQWKEVSSEKHEKDEKHAYAFTFVDYERR